MHILIVNAGSSSVKFTLFGREDLQVVTEGLVERIGLSRTKVHYMSNNSERITRVTQVAETHEAVKLFTDLLMDKACGVIQSKAEIIAIGHRVVHGGEQVKDASLVDDQLKGIIRECFDLAPLHNPPNLKGIEACQEIFPSAAQVAVFDTAFHATLPRQAFLYGLPYEYYREHNIRRYGFHGASHRYVSRKAAELLGEPVSALKMVTCHLGNGCSMAAVDQGRSIDTSMGLTPLEGLIMGSRCGDIDPSIPLYLMRRYNMSTNQVEALLNRQSGLLGLVGIASSDMRDIESAIAAGNHQAATAVEVLAYRVKKYIGAYTFAMGGLDAIVFTAGIGENSSMIREKICQGLEQMGIEIDPALNSANGGECRPIHSDHSKINILVVPTNEEKEIALQTIGVLAGL
jgi:acetate kinase